MGQDNPETLKTAFNLAQIYHQKGAKSPGEYKKAINIYTQCLEKRRTRLGQYSPYTIATMEAMAQMYSQMRPSKKNLQEAGEYFKEAHDKKKIKQGNVKMSVTWVSLTEYDLEREKKSFMEREFEDLTNLYQAFFDPQREKVAIQKEPSFVEYRVYLESPNDLDTLQEGYVVEGDKIRSVECEAKWNKGSNEVTMRGKSLDKLRVGMSLSARGLRSGTKITKLPDNKVDATNEHIFMVDPEADENPFVPDDLKSSDKSGYVDIKANTVIKEISGDSRYFTLSCEPELPKQAEQTEVTAHHQTVIDIEVECSVCESRLKKWNEENSDIIDLFSKAGRQKAVEDLKHKISQNVTKIQNDPTLRNVSKLTRAFSAAASTSPMARFSSRGFGSKKAADDGMDWDLSSSDDEVEKDSQHLSHDEYEKEHEQP